MLPIGWVLTQKAIVHLLISLTYSGLDYLGWLVDWITDNWPIENDKIG